MTETFKHDCITNVSSDVGADGKGRTLGRQPMAGHPYVGSVQSCCHRGLQINGLAASESAVNRFPLIQHALYIGCASMSWLLSANLEVILGHHVSWRHACMGICQRGSEWVWHEGLGLWAVSLQRALTLYPESRRSDNQIKIRRFFSGGGG